MGFYIIFPTSKSLTPSWFGGLRMSDIRVNKGYFPGAIGQVTELHGTYYHSHWGFGLYFEAMVATGLSTFLKRYDESRDGFWTVSEKERV
ncbi:MAG: hypothetical protein DSY89_08480, partial [Deltaproteobacteria bacterium]